MPIHEEMSPKAADAFASYIAMGPTRSLTRLARELTDQGCYKTAPTARRVIAEWSSKHRWQERIAVAITAKIEEALSRSAELDAHSFLVTSELIAKQLAVTSPAHIDAVVKIRESVRKPEPRGGTTNVNLTLSMTLRAIVERVAAEQGLSPDEVLAEAESILAVGA